ncbi:MAG: right-handed parallel beta-helix repeat-containing protein [Thermoplasmata archaeon]|nr:right-handed parallel beta-helix repeat-containing protein [Thermoplasmata archaeon]
MRSHVLFGLGLLLAAGLLLSPLASAAELPRDPSSGDAPFEGAITISPACALSGGSAPISQSGTTFTFTADWTGSLIVLCSDATIDGAGHSIEYWAPGEPDPAIALTINASSDVTIEDLVVLNASQGIQANDTSGLTIETTTISAAADAAINVSNSTDVAIDHDLLNNSQSSAVSLFNVTAASVSDNDANGSVFGIEAESSEGVSITGNNVSFGIEGVGFYYTQNANATGNQAYFDALGVWAQDSQNVSFAGNAANASYSAALWIVTSVGVTAVGNWLDDSPFIGAYVDQSASVTLGGNDLFGDMTGISAQYSQQIRFLDNNVSLSPTGVTLIHTSGAEISGNYAANDTTAFSLKFTTDTSIADNTAPNCEEAVEVQSDNGTSVVGNAFPNNTYAAVESDGDSSNFEIENNTLTNGTEFGIYVSDSFGAVTISGNDLADSPDIGVYVSGPDGPLSISGNDIADAGYDGVYLLSADGPVSLSDNDISGAGNMGAFLEDIYADSSIVGNNFTDAADVGLYTEDTIGSTFVSGNNASGSMGTGLNLEDSTGALNVTDNVASETGEYGIDASTPEGPASITDNVAVDSQELGILVDDSEGPLTISGNDVAHSFAGIVDQDQLGAASIEDNDVVDSGNVGIDVETAGGDGGVQVEDNNASGAAQYALDYFAVQFGAEGILGNDFANSGEVAINDSASMEIVGNDLLNVSNILLDNSAIESFYHNDVNTAAFDATGSDLPFGGSWNAPYPIGGNFWTGYSGTDHFSGPEQNEPGSDGIGDTPEPVPNAGAGAVDEYPLMHPWTVNRSTLRFTESGLPLSSEWSVTVNFAGFGSGSLIASASAGSSLTIPVPYGAATPYSYTVSFVAGFVATPSVGSGITGPGTTTTTVQFVPFAFDVGFLASGISAGTPWSLTVANATYPVNAAEENVTLANGTYLWTASSPGFSSVSGSVTVDGSSRTVAVAFHPVVYPVLFAESGLPSSSSWTVSFAGRPTSGTGAVIDLSAPNGSYVYTITTTSTLTPNPSSGTVVVNGDATGAAVEFTAAGAPLPPGSFAVVFSEGGLSGGASWSVTFAGTSQTSYGTTIVFASPNGTFDYSVSSSGSAAPQHPSGSVTVSGAPTTVAVLFGSANGIGTGVGSSSSGPSWPELYAVAGLAAVFVVLATLGFTQPYWRGGSGSGGPAGGRRRRADEPPPPSTGYPGAYPGGPPPTGWPPPGGPPNPPPPGTV